MKAVIVFSVLVWVAACGCDSTEQRAEQQKDAGPETVAFNPCEGQPDNSRPEGCDGVYDCSRDSCQGGTCVETPTPGGRCGRHNTGTCDQAGQCIACETKCEEKLVECRHRCWEHGDGLDRCLCVCERTYGYCLVRCGPGAPEPIICPS
jgi:hypothetical protein